MVSADICGNLLIFNVTAIERKKQYAGFSVYLLNPPRVMKSYECRFDL